MAKDRLRPACSYQDVLELINEATGIDFRTFDDYQEELNNAFCEFVSELDLIGVDAEQLSDSFFTISLEDAREYAADCLHWIADNITAARVS